MKNFSLSPTMSVVKGIWSNFSKRSPSLALHNKKLQEALLSPTMPHGPVSLKKGASKKKYVSPIGMDEIYPLAYQDLENRSAQIYEKLEETQKKLDEGQGDNQLLKREIEELAVAAEINNPEVIYNATYGTNQLDKTQPVYRKLLQDKWREHDLMLTMQRLETLGVIPDTLPTLEPEVDVKLQFPCNNVETLIEPGTILSSNVTSRPPSLEIVEFKESKNDLYTVLIVDPDTPDVENNGFTTTLHWGLKNVSLSNQDTKVDAHMLTEHPEYVFSEYLAPTPEKNTGNHRYAVWVFRQQGQLAETDSTRKNFDIRQFTASNNLQPVGAHVWRSTWDRNTENVRKQYGLPEGRVFGRDRQ